MEDLTSKCNQIFKGTFAETLGMRMVELRPGYAKAQLEIRDPLRQPLGVLHGGALVALADTTAAAGSMASTGSQVSLTTVELKVNFLAPAKDGVVTAESVPVRLGKRLTVWETRVTDSDGVLVALVVATYLVGEAERVPHGATQGKG